MNCGRIELIAPVQSRCSARARCEYRSCPGSAEGGIKPQSIRKVLARWGLQESRVAYVGDTIYDIQAASAVGVPGIGAAWGGTTGIDALKAAGAALTFTTVEEFVGWLRP